MYPDNYMNPMNNPMTNSNYGYNRMQQVQQMQRAINPQVPNMFGQVEQPQQMQSFISAVPVTCLEEAKAAKLIAILMLFVQKTTRTLVKSLLQFMQKLKQLVL